MHSPRRGAVVVALAFCVSLLGAHLVDASWAVTTRNGGSTFATGSIAAPTGVGAASTLARKITLTWTAPVAAQQGTGTRIDRNVNGGAYTTLTTVSPGSVATYANTGLTTGSTYCYKLTTVDALWTAGPTTAVCAISL